MAPHPGTRNMIRRLWLFVFISKLASALNKQCSNSISTSDLRVGFRYERNSNPPFYALNVGSVSETPTGWKCKRQLNVAFPIGPNVLCPSTCLRSLITYYNESTGRSSFSIQRSVNRLGDYELPAYVSEVHCAIEKEACGATIPLFLIQSPIYGDYIGTEEEKRPRLRRRLRDLYFPICYAWSTVDLKMDDHTSNCLSQTKNRHKREAVTMNTTTDGMTSSSVLSSTDTSTTSTGTVTSTSLSSTSLLYPNSTSTLAETTSTLLTSTTSTTPPTSTSTVETSATSSTTIQTTTDSSTVPTTTIQQTSSTVESTSSSSTSTTTLETTSTTTVPSTTSISPTTTLTSSTLVFSTIPTTTDSSTSTSTMLTSTIPTSTDVSTTLSSTSDTSPTTTLLTSSTTSSTTLLTSTTSSSTTLSSTLLTSTLSSTLSSTLLTSPLTSTSTLRSSTSSSSSSIISSSTPTTTQQVTTPSSSSSISSTTMNSTSQSSTQRASKKTKPSKSSTSLQTSSPSSTSSTSTQISTTSSSTTLLSTLLTSTTTDSSTSVSSSTTSFTSPTTSSSTLQSSTAFSSTTSSPTTSSSTASSSQSSSTTTVQSTTSLLSTTESSSSSRLTSSSSVMTSSSSIGLSSFYFSQPTNITPPSPFNLTTKFRLNSLIRRFCRLNSTVLSSWNTTDVSALVTQIGNHMNLTDVELNQLRSLVADANLSAADVRSVLSSCQQSNWNSWTKRPQPDKSLENDFHFPGGDNPGDGSWSDDFQGSPGNIPPPFPSFTFPWLPQSGQPNDTSDFSFNNNPWPWNSNPNNNGSGSNGYPDYDNNDGDNSWWNWTPYYDDNGWSNRDRRIWRWVVLAVCCGFILILALAILCAALYRPTVQRRIIVTPYNNQIYTKDGRNDALPPVPVSPMQSYPNVRY